MEIREILPQNMNGQSICSLQATKEGQQENETANTLEHTEEATERVKGQTSVEREGL
jgi:hypothetical protein